MYVLMGRIWKNNLFAVLCSGELSLENASIKLCVWIAFLLKNFA